MKKPNPTVFSISIPANDASFLFSPISMREMEAFTAREKEIVGQMPDADEQGRAKLLAAKHQLYRELIAKSMTKAGDVTAPEELDDLDAPTFNTLFNEIMTAHGMTLKAETKQGELKASASS